jgi:hypothetical protein
MPFIEVDQETRKFPISSSEGKNVTVARLKLPDLLALRGLMGQSFCLPPLARLREAASMDC